MIDTISQMKILSNNRFKLKYLKKCFLFLILKVIEFVLMKLESKRKSY